MYTCYLQCVCTNVHCVYVCWSHVDHMPFTGSQKDILPSEDVHTVASLLKLYLRELPEPIIPYTLFEDAAYAVRGVLPSSLSPPLPSSPPLPPYPLSSLPPYPLSSLPPYLLSPSPPLSPLLSLNYIYYLVLENNQEEGIEKVLKILQILPSFNYNLLKYTW